MIASDWPRRLAPVTLGLALWTALPSLEWCPFTWDECRAACEAITADACLPPIACEAEASCALPCDPSPDPPMGDRAWCIHPPVEGVTARGVDLEIPAPLPGSAVLVEPATVPAPTESPARGDDRANLCPALARAHAPPRVRAPPLT